jgi:hypothetical protein
MSNYGYQPYNGYPQYPYGYQYQMQRQGQMAMQQQMPPQQPVPMQYEPPRPDLKFVTSEEAKAYIVMPNSSVLLIDKQGGMAYLKSADQMGQSFTEAYVFQRHTPHAKPQETAQNQTKNEPSIDLSNYATKDDLGAIKTLTKDDITEMGFVSRQDYEKLAQTVEILKKQFAPKPVATPNKGV